MTVLSASQEGINLLSYDEIFPPLFSHSPLVGTAGRGDEANGLRLGHISCGVESSISRYPHCVLAYARGGEGWGGRSVNM